MRRGRFLAVLAVCALAPAPARIPLWQNVWSDGCSVPQLLEATYATLNRSPALRAACVRHDAAYYYGGSREDRLRADLQLALDWVTTGELTASEVERFYAAVRAGGGPEWYRPRVSWAFGPLHAPVFAYTTHPAQPRGP